MIPLSALNHFLFCSRRAALIHIEGIFEENQHTIRGELAHEHADLPGYEVAKGVTLLRALPVWSERLGLNGKCDIVEVHATPQSRSSGRQSAQTSLGENQSRLTSAATIPKEGTLVPVEYKKGKRRQFDNDDAQLCAQAICLEEMFNVSIPRGAIFHADSKRRREVEFTADLRAKTEAAAHELHALLDSQRVPPAVFKPACEECSLYEICLPKATAEDSRAERLTRQLFQI